MNNFNSDMTIGLIFIAGVWSFVSGQFIFSTVLFAAAAIYSSINARAKLNSQIRRI